MLFDLSIPLPTCCKHGNPVWKTKLPESKTNKLSKKTNKQPYMGKPRRKSRQVHGRKCWVLNQVRFWNWCWRQMKFTIHHYRWILTSSLKFQQDAFSAIYNRGRNRWQTSFNNTNNSSNQGKQKKRRNVFEIILSVVFSMPLKTEHHLPIINIDEKCRVLTFAIFSGRFPLESLWIMLHLPHLKKILVLRHQRGDPRLPPLRVLLSQR